MHKLPVFATAGLAYQFLLREAGTILRLSWFPLLIVTIIQYFAMRAQFAAMRSAFESGNVGALNMNFPMWQWQIANIVVALLGSAIVAVALHRVILLGDRKPGRFLYVAFGKVELLFALLPIILMVPIIVVSFLAFGLGITLLPKSASWVAFVGLFLMWVGAVFVFVRLALVLPLTVLEGRYNFSQSWSLTRGNFWRLVGLWLVVLIPLSDYLGDFQRSNVALRRARDRSVDKKHKRHVRAVGFVFVSPIDFWVCLGHRRRRARRGRAQLFLQGAQRPVSGCRVDSVSLITPQQKRSPPSGEAAGFKGTWGVTFQGGSQ